MGQVRIEIRLATWEGTGGPGAGPGAAARRRRPARVPPRRPVRPPPWPPRGRRWPVRRRSPARGCGGTVRCRLRRRRPPPCAGRRAVPAALREQTEGVGRGARQRIASRVVPEGTAAREPAYGGRQQPLDALEFVLLSGAQAGRDGGLPQRLSLAVPELGQTGPPDAPQFHDEAGVRGEGRHGVHRNAGAHGERPLRIRTPPVHPSLLPEIPETSFDSGIPWVFSGPFSLESARSSSKSASRKAVW